MRILVTRPEPGGAATAARLQALGHDVLLTPLLSLEAVPWELPATLPAAVVATSAATLRLAGPGLAALKALPLHAVGSATAAAARAAGFGDVRSGPGRVQALVEAMAAAGLTRALHLAGEDRTPVTLPPGFVLDVRTVYRARLLPLTVLPDADAVLLYSARTAAHFAAEFDRLGGDRRRVAVAAISPAALTAAGPGWAMTLTPAQPEEDALLAAIGATWQKPPQTAGQDPAAESRS